MTDLDDRFWSKLTWTERMACAVGRLLGETRPGRILASNYQSVVVVPFLGQTINNRLHCRGLEHLPRGESFIIAANHRSYFDLYAVMIGTWRFFERPPYLYCPVRTPFFYEQARGVAFNMAICGNAMYPPVFRGSRGRGLNRFAVDRAVRLLAWSSRTVIAMHPEGKRSKAQDPYTYLAPRPGIGRIALRSRRPVLPIYVGGLPSSFGALVRDRLSPDGQPVRVNVGAPVDLEDLYDRPEEPAAHREAAARSMAAVAAAGERDRAWMIANGHAP